MSVVMPQRQALTRTEWARMASQSSPPLLALWADTREVYALLRDGAALRLVSTEVEEGGYPALSPARTGAAWFERMVHDLWGHIAIDGVDPRPWLDHGHWPNSAPMSAQPGPGGRGEAPEFLLAEGLDQIPLGPVCGQIAPAAHLRLGVRGEGVVRLETRLGYTHKGTLSLMRGKSPRAAARFAARLAGEASIAHSIAFARAIEAALGCEVPPRALALRLVTAETECAVTNLDVVTAIAEVTGLETLSVRFAWHAEMVRRAAHVAFGHRLMMDCVVPGGVATDVAAGGSEAVGRALTELSVEMPKLRCPLIEAQAHQRLSAIDDSIRQVNNVLDDMPEGALSAPLPAASGEAIGYANGPNGEIWHWLRLDHGQIASVFMYDPAWARWPQLEAAMTGGQMEDLPLAMAALGLSSSGVDL
jgi:Ni,Fe-hydrogenase III large subunit